MKSRITKFSVATIMIIAIFMGVNFFFGTGSNAAFASITEIAKTVPWMHIEVQTASDKIDAWISYREGIIAIQPANKEAIFVDTNKRASWQYDPNSKIITKRTAEGNDSDENSLGTFGNSPIHFCDQIIALIKDAGGNVQEEKAVIDGKRIAIYRMRGVVQDHNTSIELVIDTKRQLPLSLRQTVEEGKTVLEATGRFDYPDEGPRNIYELGVPKNAKLDEITSPTTLQGESIARKTYRDKGELVSKMNYIMLAAHRNFEGNIEMLDVVYNKGKQQRIEHSLIYGREQSRGIGTTFESMLAWAQGYHASIVEITVYDGKFGCQTQKNDDGSWKSIKKQRWYNYVGPNLHLAALGWPASFASNIHEITNEYAQGHGFICFETQNAAQVRDGKLIFPAERTLYYIDPNHDYMRVREEKYWNNSFRCHETKVETLNFDPNEIPEKPSTMITVAEFGQISDGKWYPKRIEWRIPKWDSGGKEIESSPYESTTLFLEPEPKYPDGIFDCDKFSK